MPVRETIERTTTRFEAVEIEPADPFLVDDPCPMNAGGPHFYIVGCPEIVCIHCARIVWQ